MEKENVLIKILSLLVPPIAGIFASLLMLKFSPVKTVSDILYRLFCGMISSLVLGSLALPFLLLNYPSYFASLEPLSLMFWGNKFSAKFMCEGSVFLVAGLPGWWLIACVARINKAVLNVVNNNSEKLIAAIANKVSGGTTKSSN